MNHACVALGCGDCEVDEGLKDTLFTNPEVIIGDMVICKIIASNDSGFAELMSGRKDPICISGKLIFSYLDGKLDAHIRFSKVVEDFPTMSKSIIYPMGMNTDIHNFMKFVGYNYTCIKPA